MTPADFLFKAKALAAQGSSIIDKKFVMLLADALKEAYEAGCKYGCKSSDSTTFTTKDGL